MRTTEAASAVSASARTVWTAVVAPLRLVARSRAFSTASRASCVSSGRFAAARIAALSVPSREAGEVGSLVSPTVSPRVLSPALTAALEAASEVLRSLRENSAESVARWVTTEMVPPPETREAILRE